MSHRDHDDGRWWLRMGSDDKCRAQDMLFDVSWAVGKFFLVRHPSKLFLFYFTTLHLFIFFSGSMRQLIWHQHPHLPLRTTTTDDKWWAVTTKDGRWQHRMGGDDKCRASSMTGDKATSRRVHEGSTGTRCHVRWRHVPTGSQQVDEYTKSRRVRVGSTVTHRVDRYKCWMAQDTSTCLGPLVCPFLIILLYRHYVQ
jgi:hypothetical protein